MKNKNRFGLAIIGLVLLATSCETDTYFIEGNGDIVTETLLVNDFTGINMSGAADINIFYGSEQEVLVTGDANIIDRIKTDVSNGIWHMELERGRYRHYKLEYNITLPQINTLANDGAARIKVNDFVNQGDLSITVNGAGDIELNRMENTENLYISLDGTGVVKALGEFPSLQYMDLYFTGSGSFMGFPAVTDECRIEIDGAAKCEVSVENQLDVFIDGAGVVHYKGSPVVSQHVSGLGTVSSRN
jgi:hypothetical protein